MLAKDILKWIARYESQNVTFIEPDGSWPIVWARAKGVHVWDTVGKKYLDLTGAFGVAAAGHANPRVVKAGQKQMGKLLHAMGDVHPHEGKARLARELSRITFERWKASTGKTIFCNSGFEAVEAALKTAMLATGKRGVIAFNGAYHGLGYGALNVTQRAHFRGPFVSQLKEFGKFVDFPVDEEEMERSLAAVRRLLKQHHIGAILVEPIQVRGGVNVPPPGFLGELGKLCDKSGALLVLDEIYTGFGRTGRWLACEHEGVVPDLICLGKALTGGFPLSACVGRAKVMDAAWPATTGEAIHTSTFLGHPVGCAMALAQIAEIGSLDLIAASRQSGRELLKLLAGLDVGSRLRLEPRGLGLLAGLELRLPDGTPASAITIQIIKRMLKLGYILLPEGEHGNIISFTPPLTIAHSQLRATVTALSVCLNSLK